MMNRREFVGGLAAGAVATSLSCPAQPRTAAKLEIEAGKKGPVIPEDFVGLSYESAGMFTIIAIATYCPAVIAPLFPHRLQS